MTRQAGTVPLRARQFQPTARDGAGVGPSDAEILAADLAELLSQAAAVRDLQYGARVTFSPKVFIPLTMLCRDRCGYCTFAKPPARLAEPYLNLDQVLAIARAGAEAGCHEALFTLGERPELRYPLAAAWLEDHGYSSTVEYLAECCRLVTAKTGLLAHSNAGALERDELASLREVAVSQGMMLESLNGSLACHRNSPDKTPARRLLTLESAGELSIAFTTGILVGIGETRADRLVALRAIASSHARHGHVQEVIVQNFLPKTGTAMHAVSPCTAEEHLWSIAAARLVLPPDIHLQAPPNLTEDFSSLLGAGIDDWGGVSPVTADHVNPERAWPALERLAQVTEGQGHVLAPRLAVHPQWATPRFVDDKLSHAIMDRSDAEGLARDSKWCSGGEEAPPRLVPESWLSPFGRPGQTPERRRTGTRARGAVDEVLTGVLAGQEVGEEEIVTLFRSRGPEVVAVAALADELRRQAVGDAITFVVNRNINYTNICTFKCRFCAFSKGPLSLNLRGSPYLLGLDEITGRVLEAEARGATEVCLQGGIHPDFDGEYYIEVLKAVRAASQKMHIHAFTALEVAEGARRLGEPLESYLTRLKDAGLRTLPGTAAEVLDDEVRAVLCPDKVTTEQWLEVHRVAHSVGLRSNVTIMFGSVEEPRHWARHLVVTRSLQKETGGFTEFVPLPFVHMASPIYLQKKARRGPRFREALLMHAVGRIAYRGLIDNIQASWVKIGLEGARQLLVSGCNDLGGTLMDENISRAAGATHGQAMEAADFAEVAESLGRPLEQRTTLYGRVAPIGATL